MRYLPFLALLGIASVNAQSMSKCAADNCLRAIRASAFPNRSGTADCMSFFRSYVTVTVTATATTTLTDSETIATTTIFNPGGNQPARRQAGGPPPGIPAYASPCSGLARYSSACACIGVTETADPSTTIMTVTSSTTEAVVATATISDFVMQLQDFFPGQYVAFDDFNYPYPSFTTNIADAAVFRRLPDGHIEYDSIILKTSPYSYYREWFRDGGDKELTCDIDVDHMLTCVSEEWNLMGVYIFFDDNPYLAQARSVSDFEATGGGEVRIKALPPPPAALPAP